MSTWTVKITDLRHQTNVMFAFCYLADDGCCLESHIWRSHGSGQSSCSVFVPGNGEKVNKGIGMNQKQDKTRAVSLSLTQIQILIDELFRAMADSENP